MSWLPGGLMHSNIGSCMAFAATAGSSVATAATIGTVAMPLVERHGYNQRLFLGSLAAGGTLGILIPPSINLIIYGWLTETSVPKLYLAGFLPGVILGILFSLTKLIGRLLVPRWGGDRIDTSWRQRIASLPALIPPLLLPPRSWLDLCGFGDADRVGLAWRGRGLAPGRRQSAVELANASRGDRRLHAHHGDDHADRHRRLVSELQMSGPRG